jgi:hypothetical protein
MWINGTNTHLVGNWPGSPATHLGGGTFKFVLPEEMQGDESQWMIIWNNNGKGLQTADLKFTMRGLYYTTNSDIKGTACKSVVSTLCKDITGDVDQVVVDKSTARKLLIDGMLYIMLPDGRVYNVQGTQVY